MTPTTTPMPAWLESAWLARYLDRQLSDDEAAWFEAYLLDKPELLGVVEADNSVRDTVAKQKAIGMASDKSADDAVRLENQTTGARNSRPRANSSVDNSGLKKRNLDKHRTRKYPVMPLALVATALAALGLGWFGQLIRPRDQVYASVVASPTRIVFDTMRGTPSEPKVESPDSTSPYILVEAAVPPGSERIEISIGEEPPKLLKQTPDGFANFLITREAIQQARHVVLSYYLEGQKSMRVLELNSKEVAR